jgi:hypothetical protein
MANRESVQAETELFDINVVGAKDEMIDPILIIGLCSGILVGWFLDPFGRIETWIRKKQ